LRVRNPIPIRKARLEVMPMIDIMFFLLAAFVLVSLTLTKQQTIPLQLPAVTTARPDFEPDNINLAVDAVGIYYLNETPLNLAEIQSALAELHALDPSSPLFISGDENTNHGAMMRLLDTVRRVGFTRVAFNVRPEGSGGAPADATAGGGDANP
jgi:biopolymer transport protein ExbD